MKLSHIIKESSWSQRQKQSVMGSFVWNRTLTVYRLRLRRALGSVLTPFSSYHLLHYPKTECLRLLTTLVHRFCGSGVEEWHHWVFPPQGLVGDWHQYVRCLLGQKIGFQNRYFMGTLQEGSGMLQLWRESFVFLWRPFQRAAQVSLSTQRLTPWRQDKSHTVFDDLLSKFTLCNFCNDLLTMQSTIFCAG